MQKPLVQKKEQFWLYWVPLAIFMPNFMVLASKVWARPWLNRKNATSFLYNKIYVIKPKIWVNFKKS